MINKDYVYPIIFLVLPTLLSLALFIEQKVLSHGSYLYEIQDSDEWYSKDLDLKDKSWDEVKLEIDMFNDHVNKISYNFASDVYDKNSLHVLTMQCHKKLIVLKQHMNSLNKKEITDYENYNKKLENIDELLEQLISYNNNTIKPDYTSEFANIVNIVYLPLAVITGYFGMNFASMGIHGSKEPGVYNENRGQFFVLLVALIVIIIFIYIMFETNKPYGTFDYFYKGKNKFTLTDYIFGTKKRDQEKIRRDKIGKELKDKYSKANKDGDNNDYTISNPPPSLNIYNKERDSLAPPIIRNDNLGPYDNSLFEYKL